MSSSEAAGSNDRLFCWEQITRTNPAFRVSQVFATREDASRLLPLYALFAIVEQICSASSDEELAHRKLDWWRIESSAKKLAESHHPVLREFQRTGSIDSLAQDLLQILLDSAESRLEGRPPADISELKDLCINVQRPQCELEARISGMTEWSFEPCQGMLARGGMLQLIRESVFGREQGAYWWVPLNYLARYGVSRSQLVEKPGSPESAQLLSSLIAESDSWISSSKLPQVQTQVHSLRNYFAISGLYERKINKLKRVSPSLYINELRRVRVADLMIAWRCARRKQI